MICVDVQIYRSYNGTASNDYTVMVWIDEHTFNLTIRRFLGVHGWLLSASFSSWLCSWYLKKNAVRSFSLLCTHEYIIVTFCHLGNENLPPRMQLQSDLGTCLEKPLNFCWAEAEKGWSLKTGSTDCIGSRGANSTAF